jgi:hypothetical protein
MTGGAPMRSDVLSRNAARTIAIVATTIAGRTMTAPAETPIGPMTTAGPTTNALVGMTAWAVPHGRVDATTRTGVAGAETVV